MENEQDESQYEDVETSENNEEQEDSNEEESNENSEENSEVEELKQKNKDLFERAKKAEALAKQFKKPTNKTNVSEEDLIRTARIASQLDDDDLEMLSSLNGTMQEKLENPLFKAYKESKARKSKSESASLKPSGGATATKAKPNMTAEEHKAWVKKLMS